jgi:hypothetical protein
MEVIACPLCRGHDPSVFVRDVARDYHQCRTCWLVFVPREQLLSREDEKKRYDLHQYSADDSGYQAYLSRLAKPMIARIKPGSWGLDFGCGPEPVLASLFRKAGHVMSTYDFFYRPDDTVFDERYDFITASEVVEHLRRPGRELDRLWRCLEPSGILGIMTQWVVPAERFPTWHYKNDRTHICFFSPETFTWLARKWNAELVLQDRDVALFLKP